MTTQVDKAQEVPFEDRPIGDRKLTTEEAANAAFYGISERDARNYTPRQLEDLAADWLETQYDRKHLGS